MSWIEDDERLRLRQLAHKQLEYANCPRNDEILKQWDALAHGRKESPTVRLLFSNFPHEVVYPRMQCRSALARRVEASLLTTLVGRELFDDDTPISPTFDISWEGYCQPFGGRPHITPVNQPGSNGYHIDPIIEELPDGMDLFRQGSFGVNRESTLLYRQQVEDILGDILPTRMVMNSLGGAITNPLVHLLGMENYYYAMYDYPDELHEVMELGTRIYEQYYDFLEREQLLLPTNGISPICQESFAFTTELPTGPVTSTKECWGFLESQETTAVSPELFGEFVFPYQDRLVRRFGLLSYGCCERVDDIWPDYLSKWKNLRKLSVSPFNKEPLVGEYLRGTNVIYYSKPRAEYVTNPGPLDEPALREYFKGVCQSASGCLFEMAQREVGTIFGDFERGKRYVQIARACIADYWQP